MKTLMLILVLGLLIGGGTCPAFAEDGNNVPDQLGDIFSGKGNTYAGVEVNNIPIPFVRLEPLPFMELEPITLMAWADVMAGKIDDGVKRDMRGGIRVAIDWQKIFK